jgi:hypothetical protein
MFLQGFIIVAIMNVLMDDNVEFYSALLAEELYNAVSKVLGVSGLLLTKLLFTNLKAHAVFFEGCLSTYPSRTSINGTGSPKLILGKWFPQLQDEAQAFMT